MRGIFSSKSLTISIHAPRTGSDRAFLRKSAEIGISIHAPRTGSDVCWITFSTRNCQFQSTLPARGATATMHKSSRGAQNFNPRSLHGERLPARGLGYHPAKFQSTLPARGATYRLLMFFSFCRISIHAPRTGSDQTVWKHSDIRRNFNPRSPHGERRSFGLMG